MGSGESTASFTAANALVETFQNLSEQVRRSVTDGTTADEERALVEHTQSFFKVLQAYLTRDAFFLDQLSDIFRSIKDSLQVLFEALNRTEDGGRDPVWKARFVNDYLTICQTLLSIIVPMTSLLNRLRREISVSLMNALYIYVSCLESVLEVTKTTGLPYYKCKCVTMFQITDTCFQTAPAKKPPRYLNVVSQNTLDNMYALPILMAILACEEGNKHPFLVCILSEAIYVETVSERLTEVLEGTLDEFEGVAKTASRFVELFDKLKGSVPESPVIAVLTRYEAINLLHTVKDKSQLFNYTRFILDGVEKQTVETDILLMLLETNAIRVKPPAGGFPEQLVFVSSTPNSLRRTNMPSSESKELSVDDRRKFPVNHVHVKADSVTAVLREQVLKNAITVFDDWGKGASKTPVGSMLVYLPSDQLCWRFANKIISVFEKRPLSARPIVPLTAQPLPGDDVIGFFARVQQEIQRIELEKRTDLDGKQPIFFCALVISRFTTENSLRIVCDPLPGNLQGKMIRVVVTTGDGPSLPIPDATVLIDSGFHEVEYYDKATGFSVVAEEPLATLHDSSRQSVVGGTENCLVTTFDVAGIKRPEKDVPEVQRINLTKASFALRKIGCNFGALKNLANEPNYDLLHACENQLTEYGLTDARGNITTFGTSALKYSSLSPLFAAATARYVEQKGSVPRNAVLPFIVFYIIEYGYYLLVDSSNPCLCDVFDQRSDLVTLFSAVCKFLKDDIGTNMSEYCKTITNAGLQDLYVCELRRFLLDILNGECSIADALASALPPGKSAYDEISDVLKCAASIDQNWFGVRTAAFEQITNAAGRTGAVLKYKCEKEIPGQKNPMMCIEKRPGWKSLAAPARCYILSIRSKKSAQDGSITNHGFLLHQIDGKASLGVVSREVEPVYNSPFFVALIQAYLGEDSGPDFIGIQLGSKETTGCTVLIHISNTNEATYVNYCPKNTAADKKMTTAFQVIRRLLPFVPKSLLVKYDQPLCAVELFNIGGLKYQTLVHVLAQEGVNPPYAYNLNRKLIDDLAQEENIRQLAKLWPNWRLAITGESFVYKLQAGRQVTADLTIPDTRPSLKSVFGEWTSHLVLVIDRECPPLAGHTPIPWISADTETKKPANAIDPTDTIAVAASIFEAHGAVSRADIFIITLNGNQLCVDDGNVPEELTTELGYAADTKIVQRNYHELVQCFAKRFMERGKSEEDIPIKVLSSKVTSQKSNIDNREQFLKTLEDGIRKAWNLKGARSVLVQWLGDEAIACHVDGLPLKDTLHEGTTKVYGVEYHPCEADKKILKLIDPNLKATVVHETCVGFTITHTEQQRLTEARFMEIVNAIKDRYGFAITYYDVYESKREGLQLGCTFLEIANPVMAISLAETLRSAIPIDATFDPDKQLQMTMTMKTQNRRIAALPKEEQPKVKWNEQAYHVPDQDITLLKQKLAQNTAWKFDERSRMLIVPWDEEDQAKAAIAQMNSANGVDLCYELDDPCFEDTKTWLPLPLYVFHRDGSCRVTRLHDACQIMNIREKTDLFFNWNTKTLDFTAVRGAKDPPGMLQSIVEDELDADEPWPTVPIGSLLWCLMSSNSVRPYVRAWVTGAVEHAMAVSDVVITCPNHPMFRAYRPTTNITIQCDYCEMIMCGQCKLWHELSEPCTVLPKIKGCQYCPGCQVSTYKTEGCNRITCKTCGWSWCWVCRAKFRTADECYAHLHAAHGGCWGKVDV